MKKLELLKAFVAAERLDRPKDISRTRVSRESDRDIDAFSVMLGVFIAIWLAKGFFSQQEKEEMSTLFRKNAEVQYIRGQNYTDSRTGEPKPLTRQDIDRIEELSNKAEQDFIAGLERQAIKVDDADKLEERVETVAETTASDLGTRALNQGTLSHAQFVQYVTRRDARVCPICEDLDRNVYEVDERTGIIKDGPVIPDDTHPNCRCRYIPIEGDAQEP